MPKSFVQQPHLSLRSKALGITGCTGPQIKNQISQTQVRFGSFERCNSGFLSSFQLASDPSQLLCTELCSLCHVQHGAVVGQHTYCLTILKLMPLVHVIQLVLAALCLLNHALPGLQINQDQCHEYSRETVLECEQYLYLWCR